MNAPIIDRKAERIIITREFDRLSSVFDTKEYRTLVQLQRNHPNFDVVVQKDKHRKKIQSNFTNEFMAKYIKSHDDNSGSIMDKFLILRGKKEDNGKLTKVSHFELQKWFIDTFPEIKDRVDDAKETTSKLMREAAENAEKHRVEREKRKEEQGNA